MEIINFLYNDLDTLSYAKMLSDEVRGHFTKLAYQEYEKSDTFDYDKFLRMQMKLRLQALYKEYYETTLSVTEFQNNGERLRKEIEELKIKLEINS